jgi:anti-sigma regulatory factor (Ser/Thr protein kinase)
VSGDSGGVDETGEIADTHTGAADPPTVVLFRRSLDAWLDQHLELDDNRVADIVLAADEALSNCADHAYRVVESVGPMTLRISYHPAMRELKVYVSDSGRWMEPETSDHRAANTVRGRGILLMRALADDCFIDGRTNGTTVCLRFYGCEPNSCALSHAS